MRSGVDVARIAPTLTLRDVYGDVVFSPVMSYRAPGWLPDRESADARTGNLFAVAGSTPVICHAGATTPRALAMFDAAGMTVPPNVLTYDTQADYEALVRRVEPRLALHYAHADGELPSGRTWIPQNLLRYLNNKASIHDLVPAPNRARRRVVPADRLHDEAITSELPFVVKAAADVASGGGVGVRVCKDIAALDDARAVFPRGTNVVIESFLDIGQNLCVQFAAMPDGAIVYIGTAEQVSDASGSYRGNWLGATPPCAAAVDVGRRIMDRAVAMGYVGIAGFDMAVADGAEPVVFDLNFRFNGSTVPLLLHPSLGGVMRFRGWTGPARDTDAFLAVARRAIGGGALVPLSVWDPGVNGAMVRVSGLVLGASREEAEDLDVEISRKLAETTL